LCHVKEIGDRDEELGIRGEERVIRKEGIGNRN
jgi:hypothetical protein